MTIMNSKADAELGDSPGSNVPVYHNEKSQRRVRSASLFMRLAAVPLCVAALVLMVTDKETHKFTIPITPPIEIIKEAKYDGVKALVFYVYVTGVVAGYHFLHALFSLVFLCKGGAITSCFWLWFTFIMDQLTVYLLLAAASATTEVAYIAERGEPGAGWTETCGVFGKFCNRVGASIFVCFCGLLGLCAVAALSAHQLFSSAASKRPSKTGGR